MRGDLSSAQFRGQHVQLHISTANQRRAMTNKALHEGVLRLPDLARGPHLRVSTMKTGIAGATKPPQSTSHHHKLPRDHTSCRRLMTSPQFTGW